MLHVKTNYYSTLATKVSVNDNKRVKILSNNRRFIKLSQTARNNPNNTFEYKYRHIHDKALHWKHRYGPTLNTRAIPLTPTDDKYADEFVIEEYYWKYYDRIIRNYMYINYFNKVDYINTEGNNNKEEKGMKYDMDNDDKFESMMRKAKYSMSSNLKGTADKFIKIDKIYEKLESWVIDKIKTHFGKEFKLYGANNMKSSVHLKDFLEKYDKNFEKHVNNNTLLDFETMCYLEVGTFMYIATGRFVPAKMDYTFMNQNTEDVYIYIFGHSAPKYWKELEKVNEADSTKDKGGLIFNVSRVQTGSYNITSMDLHKRGFDKLYFSNGEIDIIKKHLDRFKETYEMYNSKQLNYKTGILLYGDPGTGKTSLARAIASEYNRSICAITISSIADIDFAELATMINNDVVDTYIILFEDIDTIDNALSSREAAPKKKSSRYDDEDNEDTKPKSRNDIMNALMQFLDGVNSPNNVIFVATTNYVDRLDAAFVRAGRFDLKVEVKPLERKDALDFILSFDISEDTALRVLREYEETYPDDVEFNHKYNQAKLQGITIKYIK